MIPLSIFRFVMLLSIALLSGCRTTEPRTISPSPLIFSARPGDTLPPCPDGSPSWAVMTSKKLQDFLRKVEP
jgi:hypothetical protein